VLDRLTLADLDHADSEKVQWLRDTLHDYVGWAIISHTSAPANYR
jgi:hypothetical protein